MSDEDRLKRIVPILRERSERKANEFAETFPFGNMVKPFLKRIKKEERETAYKETQKFFRVFWPSVLRPAFEMQEMSLLAKEGAGNMLKAMGYNPKIDASLKGFSGNKYTLSIVAPTDKRLLIVDQMMLSQELMIPWLKVQMPKTFDSYKVTVADFFKYLDVSMGLASKPSIYWLHDYKVSREFAESIGFSFKRMMKDVLLTVGRMEGVAEGEIKKEMLDDEEFKEILNIFDTSLAEMFGGIGEAITKLGTTSKFPFSIKRTANRFCIPCISTQLLDMLEASILDPKSPSEARTLKGYAFELGLLDFLNPPWSDYVLAVARSQKSTTFSKVNEILDAAEVVGHEGRSIRELHVDPKKLKDDPSDGLEALEQNNLVTIEAKETYKITSDGREYMKEVRKRPRKHAIRKALECISGHVSINIPPFIIKGKKKDKDEE